MSPFYYMGDPTNFSHNDLSGICNTVIAITNMKSWVKFKPVSSIHANINSQIDI